MSAEEFVDMVEQMRDAQRDYFRSRDQQSLRKCKHLEGLVDQAIHRHRHGVELVQGDFFEKEARL